MNRIYEPKGSENSLLRGRVGEVQGEVNISFYGGPKESVNFILRRRGGGYQGEVNRSCYGVHKGADNLRLEMKSEEQRNGKIYKARTLFDNKP